MNTVVQSFREHPPMAGPVPVFEWVSPEVTTLSNGIKVIVVTHTKLPVLSVTLSFDAGLYFEGSKAGVGRLASQLMTRGTELYTKSALDDKIDFLGLSLQTSQSASHIRGLKKFSAPMMEILSEVTRKPIFPKSEFDLLKNQAVSALAAEKHEPGVIASNIEQRVNYPETHPYSSVMTLESLNAITVADCRDFYNFTFTPGNAYLIMIGDIQSAEALELATEYFGDWDRPSASKLMLDAIPPIHQNRWHIANKPGAAQSLISLSYPVSFRYDDADRIAAMLMNTTLGGYFSSRLNANLREDKGYTYGIRSSLMEDDYSGSFQISVNVRTEVTNDAVGQIMLEMKRLREELLSPEELNSVKAVLSGAFAHSFENPGTLAQFAIRSLKYQLPQDYYQTYLQRLENVSAADIQAMAIRFLHPDNANIVIVGDESELLRTLPEISGKATIHQYNFEGLLTGTKAG